MMSPSSAYSTTRYSRNPRGERFTGNDKMTDARVRPAVTQISVRRPCLGLMPRNNTIVARSLRTVNHNHGCLIPADIRSWLPPTHLAWRIIAVTGWIGRVRRS